MPLLSLALGGVVFAAMAVGGNPGDGLKSLSVFVVVASVFALGGRSDTLRGLGGPGRDERWSMIDLGATAVAGVTLVLGLTGAWLWELADGGDGGPYAAAGDRRLELHRRDRVRALAVLTARLVYA